MAVFDVGYDVERCATPVPSLSVGSSLEFAESFVSKQVCGLFSSGSFFLHCLCGTRLPGIALGPTENVPTSKTPTCFQAASSLLSALTCLSPGELVERSGKEQTYSIPVCNISAVCVGVLVDVPI